MSKSYLIDTNLLVLLIVGKTSEDFIRAHKRTLSYTIDDFVLLDLILSDAEKIIVTPTILSETSNLLRHFSEPGRGQVMELFKNFIDNSCENYIASTRAAQNKYYERLGLTDASILVAQKKGITLVTDDLDLYLASDAMGMTAINFSHERERMIGG